MDSRSRFEAWSELPDHLTAEEKEQVLSDPVMVRFYAKRADQRRARQGLLIAVVFALAIGLAAGLALG